MLKKKKIVKNPQQSYILAFNCIQLNPSAWPCKYKRQGDRNTVREKERAREIQGNSKVSLPPERIIKGQVTS